MKIRENFQNDFTILNLENSTTIILKEFNTTIKHFLSALDE